MGAEQGNALHHAECAEAQQVDFEAAAARPAAAIRWRHRAGCCAAFMGSLLAWPATAAGPQFMGYNSTLAETDFGDARLSGQEYGMTLDWPLEGSGWRPADLGLEYTYTRYEYEGLPTRNRDLHRVAAPVRWRWAGALAHSFELRPVIATSSNVMKDFFNRGTSDDVMLHGRWRVERAPAATGAGWRAGVARDDAFGSWKFYPEVAALWRTPAAELGLGWPRSWASYRPVAAWLLSAELAPVGARWHVVSDERDGAEFDYEVEAWRGVASARWQSASGVLIVAQGGLEFGRRHRLEDDQGGRVDRPADDAAYFEIRIGYQW